MSAPKVKIPQSPFVDVTTGRVSREWLQWLLNPSFLSFDIDLANVQGILPVINGGTGLITGNSGGVLGFISAGAMASSATLTANGVVIGGGSGNTPFSLAEASNGQLLIGKTGSPPSLNTLTAGGGIGIVNGPGSISVGINSTGVTPGTYGVTAAQTVSVTVNAQGQVTAISAANIAITNTQVSGLGTMSTQNANAVVITGGTINSTSIGGITPASGVFVGVNTNSNAAAGVVGEYIESIVNSVASGVALTSGLVANITNISLTAGDWDVSGTICLQPAAGTLITSGGGGSSLTSATFGNEYQNNFFGLSSGINSIFDLPLPVQRFSLAVTTTVYLVVLCNFSISTLKAGGIIRARRVR